MALRSPFLSWKLSFKEKKREQRQTSPIPPRHQLSTSWLDFDSFPHLNLTLLAPVADVVDHLGTLRPLLRRIEIVREIRATLKEDTFQFTTLDGRLDGLPVVGNAQSIPGGEVQHLNPWPCEQAKYIASHFSDGHYRHSCTRLSILKIPSFVYWSLKTLKIFRLLYLKQGSH